MKFGLDEKTVRMIVAVLKALEVPKAVIFGSRAKGNYKYNSDIDICVWGRKNVFDVEELREVLMALPLLYKFDVVGFEFINNAALKEHIETVGQPLY